jgi:hypothetical protein
MRRGSPDICRHIPYWIKAFGTAYLALLSPASAQQLGELNPVGDYTVEVRFGGASLDGLLVIDSSDGTLLGHFTLPDQPTVALGTVRVEGRDVTLRDQIAVTDIAVELRFETDSTFSGRWIMGAESPGAITGRRGADPKLLPRTPHCSDGPGDLPPPAPVPAPTPDPATARIITSDVGLFWDVIDSGPPDSLGERLHCDYLRRGTDGLRDFVPLRIVSGERLAETVTAHRARYEAARQSNLTVAGLEPEIREIYHAMKALYPEAVFSDLYFVIGRLNTGGTISQRGLLIGADMYTDHSQMLPLIAHELVHYQQRPIPPEERTLLAQAIMEGSADFVAELITGDHINHRAHEFAFPRERELWDEFSRVMHGQDYAGWLYGNAPEGRPADLAYFFGYRIAEAYHANAGAGDQAVREILNITDYAEFLERSGYDPTGR